MIRRRYLGEFGIKYLEDEVTKDRERNSFNKKHLNAYLKGHEFFFFGKDERGIRIPHKVQQEVYKA
jgi:hypothetical protein